LWQVAASLILLLYPLTTGSYVYPFATRFCSLQVSCRVPKHTLTVVPWPGATRLPQRCRISAGNMATSGIHPALHRQKILCLPQKPVDDPVHFAAIGRRLAQRENGPGIPCGGCEYPFALLLQRGEANLRRGKVWKDRCVMLQRRQQCETIRAESTPALEARRFDLIQQESVFGMIDVKSNGLAEHIFGIRKTNGLGKTLGNLR